MRRLGLFSLLAAIPALAACNSSAEVRYRVTLEVDDRGTPVSASSVWKLVLVKGIRGTYEANFQGEAVALPLAGRGTLYALLAGRTSAGKPSSYADMAMLPERLFGGPAQAATGRLPDHPDRIDDIRDISRRVGETAILDPAQAHQAWNDFPFLVRFTDPSDPKSVIAVNPADLVTHFGEGVTLRGVTVTITDDEVTAGKLGALPSFGTETGFVQWYAALTVEDPRRIGPEHFRQGM
ncbi:MAG TPA: hypothetical protein VGC35_11475 [Allosphingosinicella sp.]|jgi:hypothetical protein